jgi:hypothetical protein
MSEGLENQVANMGQIEEAACRQFLGAMARALEQFV